MKLEVISMTSVIPRPTVFSDVVCGIDGTRTSYHAVSRTCELLEPEERITILVCTNQAGVGRWATATISPTRARRALSEAGQIAKKAGLHAEKVLDPGGLPGKRLLMQAADHTLLALGAPMMRRRRAGLWIGGVTLEAVHYLPSSLLVAREMPLEAGEQVLLALDGTNDAPALTGIAAEVARRLERGLLVVHAVGVEDRSQRHYVEGQLDRLPRNLGAAPEVVIEADPPSEAILRLADERQTSLIIMGSRRVGGIRALGSVSERIAHRAHCSVMVIRPEERG
jgi:nucleotide-binding universal stress UspA family protein